MSAAPKSSQLIVQGPAGDIEVHLDEPTARTAPSHVALVCHPHPLFGGSMTNKVAHILAKTFVELGAPAVRFNFRGVGKSAGTHDDGRGEALDTCAMLEWMEHRWPSAKIWLSGFSFGAAMALNAGLAHPVDRLITVAPALRWLVRLEKRAPSMPWLILQGDQDELVNAQEVRAWSESLDRRPTLTLLPGADHFFHGRLNDVRDAIMQWMGANPTA